MSLRQVMHFRDFSETDVGAVRAAVEFGLLEARMQRRNSTDMSESHTSIHRTMHVRGNTSSSKTLVSVVVAILAIGSAAAAAYYHGLIPHTDLHHSTQKIPTDASTSMHAYKKQEILETLVKPIEEEVAPIPVKVAATAIPTIEATTAAAKVEEVVVVAPIVEPTNPPARSPSAAAVVVHIDTAAPVSAVKNITRNEAVPTASATPSMQAQAGTSSSESSDSGLMVGLGLLCAGLAAACCYCCMKGAAPKEKSTDEESALLQHSHTSSQSVVGAANVVDGGNTAAEESVVEENDASEDSESTSKINHRRQPTTHEGYRPKHGIATVDNSARPVVLGGVTRAADDSAKKSEVTVTTKTQSTTMN